MKESLQWAVSAAFSDRNLCQTSACSQCCYDTKFLIFSSVLFEVGDQEKKKKDELTVI